jgi:Ulp1 family protease
LKAYSHLIQLATRIKEHSTHVKARAGKSSRSRGRNQSSADSEPEFVTIPRSSRHKEAVLTLSDFETLTRPNGYVNGTLLNALVNLVDLAATTVTPKPPPVAVFSTWFATKLWQGGYREVSTWSQTRVWIIYCYLSDAYADRVFV